MLKKNFIKKYQPVIDQITEEKLERLAIEKGYKNKNKREDDYHKELKNSYSIYAKVCLNNLFDHLELYGNTIMNRTNFERCSELVGSKEKFVKDIGSVIGKKVSFKESDDTRLMCIARSNKERDVPYDHYILEVL